MSKYMNNISKIYPRYPKYIRPKREPARTKPGPGPVCARPWTWAGPVAPWYFSFIWYILEIGDIS